jgi:hypothetical protein
VIPSVFFLSQLNLRKLLREVSMLFAVASPSKHMESIYSHITCNYSFSLPDTSSLQHQQEDRVRRGVLLHDERPEYALILKRIEAARARMNIHKVGLDECIITLALEIMSLASKDIDIVDDVLNFLTGIEEQKGGTDMKEFFDAHLHAGCVIKGVYADAYTRNIIRISRIFDADAVQMWTSPSLRKMEGFEHIFDEDFDSEVNMKEVEKRVQSMNKRSTGYADNIDSNSDIGDDESADGKEKKKKKTKKTSGAATKNSDSHESGETKKVWVPGAVAMRHLEGTDSKNFEYPLFFKAYMDREFSLPGTDEKVESKFPSPVYQVFDEFCVQEAMNLPDEPEQTCKRLIKLSDFLSDGSVSRGDVKHQKKVARAYNSILARNVGRRLQNIAFEYEELEKTMFFLFDPTSLQYDWGSQKNITWKTIFLRQGNDNYFNQEQVTLGASKILKYMRDNEMHDQDETDSEAEKFKKYESAITKKILQKKMATALQLAYAAIHERFALLFYTVFSAGYNMQQTFNYIVKTKMWVHFNALTAMHRIAASKIPIEMAKAVVANIPENITATEKTWMVENILRRAQDGHTTIYSLNFVEENHWFLKEYPKLAATILYISNKCLQKGKDAKYLKKEYGITEDVLNSVKQFSRENELGEDAVWSTAFVQNGIAPAVKQPIDDIHVDETINYMMSHFYEEIKSRIEKCNLRLEKASKKMDSETIYQLMQRYGLNAVETAFTNFQSKMRELKQRLEQLGENQNNALEIESVQKEIKALEDFQQRSTAIWYEHRMQDANFISRMCQQAKKNLLMRRGAVKALVHISKKLFGEPSLPGDLVPKEFTDVTSVTESEWKKASKQYLKDNDRACEKMKKKWLSIAMGDSNDMQGPCHGWLFIFLKIAMLNSDFIDSLEDQLQYVKVGGIEMDVPISTAMEAACTDDGNDVMNFMKNVVDGITKKIEDNQECCNEFQKIGDPVWCKIYNDIIEQQSFLRDVDSIYNVSLKLEQSWDDMKALDLLQNVRDIKRGCRFMSGMQKLIQIHSSPHIPSMTDLREAMEYVPANNEKIDALRKFLTGHMHDIQKKMLEFTVENVDYTSTAKSLIAQACTLLKITPKKMKKIRTQNGWGAIDAEKNKIWTRIKFPEEFGSKYDDLDKNVFCLLQIIQQTLELYPSLQDVRKDSGTDQKETLHKGSETGVTPTGDAGGSAAQGGKTQNDKSVVSVPDKRPPPNADSDTSDSSDEDGVGDDGYADMDSDDEKENKKGKGEGREADKDAEIEERIDRVMNERNNVSSNKTTAKKQAVTKAVALYRKMLNYMAMVNKRIAQATTLDTVVSVLNVVSEESGLQYNCVNDRNPGNYVRNFMKQCMETMKSKKVAYYNDEPVAMAVSTALLDFHYEILDIFDVIENGTTDHSRVEKIKERFLGTGISRKVLFEIFHHTKGDIQLNIAQKEKKNVEEKVWDYSLGMLVDLFDEIQNLRKEKLLKYAIGTMPNARKQLEIFYKIEERYREEGEKKMKENASHDNAKSNDAESDDENDDFLLRCVKYYESTELFDIAYINRLASTAKILCKYYDDMSKTWKTIHAKLSGKDDMKLHYKAFPVSQDHVKLLILQSLAPKLNSIAALTESWSSGLAPEVQPEVQGSGNSDDIDDETDDDSDAGEVQGSGNSDDIDDETDDDSDAGGYDADMTSLNEKVFFRKVFSVYD